MQILIDTNVVIDWLTHREPFHEDAEYIMAECMTGNIEGNFTAHMLPDLFYILRKDFNVKERKTLLLLLCDYFQIISEDKRIITKVLEDECFDDLEDGLQIRCASEQGLDYIITRNTRDFQTSTIPALLPEEFIERYRAGQ